MKTRGALTEKHIEVLKFIQAYYDRNGTPPSIRTIQDGLAVSSPNTIHARLKRMYDNGYIAKSSSGEYLPIDIITNIDELHYD